MNLGVEKIKMSLGQRKRIVKIKMSLRQREKRKVKIVDP
jgi:hypothetical protein